MVPLRLFPDNCILMRLVIREINGEIVPLNLFPDSWREYKELRVYSATGKVPLKPPDDEHENAQLR